MIKRFTLGLAFIFASLTLAAQDTSHLRLHIDFANANGRNIPDKDTGSGITAKTVSSAAVEAMGPYSVLNLGNSSGYLDLTRNTGAIIKTLSDFTFSVYYRVDESASLAGNGYFLFSFSQMLNNSDTSGPYIAHRLNAQRMAISTGGYTNEHGMELGTASQQGRWIHFVYRQRGTTGTVYLNGRQAMSLSNMPIPSATFPVAPNYCWLGRAPFANDSYLKQTLLYDVRLYDNAISDSELQRLAYVADELEQEYRYGTPGDASELSAKLDEARAFLSSAGNDYAESAVAELRDAVTLAEVEISRGRASQQLLDAQLKKITEALNKAQRTAGFALSTTRVFTPEGHGFRHPGGMVTEEDFERARKALAEGDSRIKRAYEILCQNPYSQSDVLTWPVYEIIRGGGSGQNYMNAARGAAMAYQNALRWKLSGDDAHAEAAVRTLMNWARNNRWVGGDTNKSLAAGLYGYGFAQAAEIVRDYEGWSREDFEEFKRYMLVTWYPVALDFLRRRHDTWLNFRYNVGQRPGHYWSNWGLCNALCLMSIGILCDDVHIYNQGASFYKYDHVGTFNPDRTGLPQILNDGCNEFIGNLVPVMMPDARGPFGYLGQMQESGRDQGHALMALGLAVDICQTAFSQGDDLYAYMDDRIAAGAEFLAASNFGGVDAATLPWKNYNYADCRGTMGASWLQTGVNTGGSGEFRPYWDRLIGYYEGQRGVKLQYAEAASAAVCPDGGGGNYSQNSGGFDHLGFSTLTHWRPMTDKAHAITPLSGDIIYKGETLKNQTNLGGLKYTFAVCKTKAIPADGADITLVPQLPEGTEDTGQWQWETGETTRQITVHADRSHIYRVRYTAANGSTSEQSFAIAVAGDAVPDIMTPQITVDGKTITGTEATIIYGQSVTLYMGNSSGWTDDYQWSNGATGVSAITIPNLTEDRTYIGQYINQGGYVNECQFTLHVVPARQYISYGGTVADDATAAEVFSGSPVVLGLMLPDNAMPDEVTWHDGTHGSTFAVDALTSELTASATFRGQTYTYTLTLKDAAYSYYNLLTADNGYTRLDSENQLAEAVARGDYFVIASDDADLLVGLQDQAPMNGNRALFYQTPADPATHLDNVFTLETFEDGYCLRNVDYDGLLLQTEWDAPWNIRTHDQPYPIIWAKWLLHHEGGSWTWENGTYTGNRLGLWFPENGYAAGQEMACNKIGADVAHFQLFAIPRDRFHALYIAAHGGSEAATTPVDLTPLIASPDFSGNSWPGWTVAGTWGNQRFNGAAEVWHSTGFQMSQTLTGMPAGRYTVTCQMANGEGPDSACLYATAGGTTTTDVVRQSCVGSNFDAQRDRMSADSSYGLLSAEAIVVDDGQLTIGIREPATTANTWLVWDNFRLTYHGSDGVGICLINDSRYADRKSYDLSGRVLPATPWRRNSIVITGGKKILVQ